MFFGLHFTVSDERLSAPAIRGFENPRAISSRTSRSFWVSITACLLDISPGFGALVRRPRGCSSRLSISESKPALSAGPTAVSVACARGEPGPRSDELRVGQECVSTCRSRWLTDNSRKKHAVDVWRHNLRIQNT